MKNKNRRVSLLIALTAIAAFGCGVDSLILEGKEETKKYIGPCRVDSTGAGKNKIIRYDEYGKTLVEEWVNGEDGAIATTIQYANTYDVRGNQLSSERTATPADGWNWKQVYTYDENDKLLSVNIFGVARREITSIYDDEGRLVREEWDNNVNSHINRVYIFSYDEKGQLITREKDSMVDGEIDLRVTYTYDEDGNKSAEKWDTDANGFTNFFKTYSYDEAGNLLTQDISGDSGTSGYVYFYDCWE